MLLHKEVFDSIEVFHMGENGSWVIRGAMIKLKQNKKKLKQNICIIWKLMGL